MSCLVCLCLWPSLYGGCYVIICVTHTFLYFIYDLLRANNESKPVIWAVLMTFYGTEWLLFLVKPSVADGCEKNQHCNCCFCLCCSIFGHEDQDAEDVVYVNWLSMVRAGLLGLEFYTPESKSWRQVSCCFFSTCRLSYSLLGLV